MVEEEMKSSMLKNWRPAILVKNILVVSGLIGIILVFSFSDFSKPIENEKKEIKSELSVSSIPIPQNIVFAGEKVPVELFDVKEALERELLVNTYWHSQTLLLLKRAKRYFGQIEPIMHKNNIPDDFKYLALAESGFTNTSSPAGATGFWQFIPATAKEYGLEINNEIDERYHIEKATDAACKFLQKSHEIFKSWTMAAASYNCGRRNLGTQVQRQYSNNYYDLLLNEETSRYIFRIIALKLILNNPQEYGFNLSDEDFYKPIPYKEVKVNYPVKDWAIFAFEKGTNYKLLKYLNPWLRENFLTNKEGKTYLVKIPAAGFRQHGKELNKAEADSLGIQTDSIL
jgi:hypothetical protein